MIPEATKSLRQQLSDREVEFTRLLDAPRELVWKVWSEPAHLHAWFGPTGFTITTHEFSFVPGGEWRFIMHGPDGTDYPTHIVFREIDPPSRIVYDNAWDLPGAPIDFTVVVMFRAEGAKTRFSLRMTFAHPDAYKTAVERYGVLDGGTQTLDRLAALVDTLRR
jgi:uncharacterized protein YndB with AHSA1/START domain